MEGSTKLEQFHYKMTLTMTFHYSKKKKIHESLLLVLFQVFLFHPHHTLGEKKSNTASFSLSNFPQC